VGGKSHYEINAFLQNRLAIIIGTLLYFMQTTFAKITALGFLL